MYSSIIKKTCACGCGRWPSTGYKGFFMDCRPDLKEEKVKRQAERQKARNSVTRTQSKLRNLLKTDDEVREGSKGVETKVQLLREADRLFSEYVKRRDADKYDNIICPGCKKQYNLYSVYADGNKVVQCLHYVERNVYDLRFLEDNGHAGCGKCNLAQHLNPKGKEMKNYREFMVEKYGEATVAEMELAKRKVNKITTEQLKNIIEHYSINQLK